MNLDDIMKEIEKDDIYSDKYDDEKWDKNCGCHDDKYEEEDSYCKDRDKKREKDDRDKKEDDFYYDEDYDEYEKVSDWEDAIDDIVKDYDWEDEKDDKWDGKDYDFEHDSKCGPEDFGKKVNFVEVLADAIKFKDKQIDKDIQTIKVRANVKKVLCCDAKLIDAKAFAFPKKKGWIVVVRYHITIEFINGYKEKSFLKRVLEFKKFVPFPHKKHCKDVDFDSLKAKVVVKKIKCVDVLIKEACHCDIVCLKPVVLLEILTIATKKTPIKTVNVKRRLKRKY